MGDPKYENPSEVITSQPAKAHCRLSAVSPRYQAMRSVLRNLRKRGVMGALSGCATIARSSAGIGDGGCLPFGDVTRWGGCSAGSSMPATPYAIAPTCASARLARTMTVRPDLGYRAMTVLNPCQLPVCAMRRWSRCGRRDHPNPYG